MRVAAAAGCAASDGTGKECWIFIGCANYKILALGPIGLPRQTAFSTYTAAPLPLAGEVDALDRARRGGELPPLGALLWQGAPPPPPPAPAGGGGRAGRMRTHVCAP